MLALLLSALLCRAAAVPDGAPAPPAGGYGAPACQPRTSYVTITSTKLALDTVYGTQTRLLPTTLYQDLTETRLLPSVETHTQLVTHYGGQSMRTSTKVLYNTQYHTQHTYATETVWQMKTKTVTYTDTEVHNKYYSETERRPSYVTSTVYRTEAYPEYHHVTKTQVRYQTRTETRRVPHYVTKWATSGYPEYKFVTETATKHSYHTVTHTKHSDQYVTVCNQPSYPSYGK